MLKKFEYVLKKSILLQDNSWQKETNLTEKKTIDLFHYQKVCFQKQVVYELFTFFHDFHRNYYFTPKVNIHTVVDF
jgi:hypothetical protein